jgi:hypothetical protein
MKFSFIQMILLGLLYSFSQASFSIDILTPDSTPSQPIVTTPTTSDTSVPIATSGGLAVDFNLFFITIRSGSYIYNLNTAPTWEANRITNSADYDWRWTVTAGGEIANSDSASGVLAITANVPYEVGLYVTRKSDGVSGSRIKRIQVNTSGTVTILNNNVTSTTPPPITTKLAVSIAGDSNAYVGESKNYFANVTGAQGGISYDWIVNGNELNGSGDTISVRFWEQGTYNLSVTVTDSTGSATASKNVRFEVPTVGSNFTATANGETVVLSNSSFGLVPIVETATPVVFRAVNINSAYTYRWVIALEGGNSTVFPTSHGSTLQHQFASAGIYRISLSISGEGIQESTTTLFLAIKQATQPIMNFALNEDWSSCDKPVYKFSINPANNNMQINAVEWLGALQTSGVEQIGDPEQNALNYQFTAAGEYTIKAKVIANTHPDGVEISTTINVTEDNLKAKCPKAEFAILDDKIIGCYTVFYTLDARTSEYKQNPNFVWIIEQQGADGYETVETVNPVYVHGFKQAGTYDIALQIIDNTGESIPVSRSHSIAVNDVQHEVRCAVDFTYVTSDTIKGVTINDILTQNIDLDSLQIPHPNPNLNDVPFKVSAYLFENRQILFKVSPFNANSNYEWFVDDIRNSEFIPHGDGFFVYQFPSSEVRHYQVKLRSEDLEHTEWVYLTEEAAEIVPKFTVNQLPNSNNWQFTDRSIHPQTEALNVVVVNANDRSLLSVSERILALDSLSNADLQGAEVKIKDKNAVVVFSTPLKILENAGKKTIDTSPYVTFSNLSPYPQSNNRAPYAIELDATKSFAIEAGEDKQISGYYWRVIYGSDISLISNSNCANAPATNPDVVLGRRDVARTKLTFLQPGAYKICLTVTTLNARQAIAASGVFQLLETNSTPNTMGYAFQHQVVLDHDFGSDNTPQIHLGINRDNQQLSPDEQKYNISNQEHVDLFFQLKLPSGVNNSGDVYVVMAYATDVTALQHLDGFYSVLADFSYKPITEQDYVFSTEGFLLYNTIMNLQPLQRLNSANDATIVFKNGQFGGYAGEYAYFVAYKPDEQEILYFSRLPLELKVRNSELLKINN